MLYGRGSKRRGGHDDLAAAVVSSTSNSRTSAASEDRLLSSTHGSTSNDFTRRMEAGRSTTPASAPPSAVAPEAMTMNRSGRQSCGPRRGSKGLPSMITTVSPMLVAQSLLLLILVLLSAAPVALGQQCDNPLEIYVYDTESQCTSRNTPSAVGQLYADSSCRATQVLSQQSSSATFLLPGRYSASCVPPTSSTSSSYPLGQVNFAMSGCTSSSCSSSSGSSVCDRDGTATSTYYSRLNPPVYMVQSSANSNFVCLQLRSGSSTFWFAIFGDCTETNCGSGSTNSPTDSPPAATESPTDPPPEPTPAPNSPEPTAGPVSEPSPTPQPAPGETPAPTDVQETPAPAPAPTAGGKPTTSTGSPQDKPTPSPILQPPSQQQSQTPATNQESSSGMNVGVLVGAVLGAMIALSVVLVAGFYAGSLRQKNKQNSTGNVSPNNNGDGGSGSGKDGPGGPDGNHATWIPATMATGFATTKEIVVDPNYGDDVSTLGTPWGVMSTGPGGATVVIEDGTVAQNSVAWDYKNKPEPSLAEDSNTFASGPTAILSGALAGHRGAGGNNNNKGRTILADDSSFEKAYDDDEKDYYCDDTELDNGTPGAAHSSSLGLRFTVNVPPGKLGMVIDNAPGTVPEVRALKPDSVLVSRGVLVGDYLEQVDGMDVRDWTCLQVSQMIQKKSGQKSRELVFYRRPRNSSSGAVFTIDEL